MMMNQERIVAYRQQREAALERLKHFLLESGDSPRSVVKSEALVQFALGEVSDLMEAVEAFHNQVLEESVFFQASSLDLVKAVESVVTSIDTSLADQVNLLAKEREEADKSRDKLLELYRTLWKNMDSISKNTERLITEKAAIAEVAVQRAGDEVVGATLSQMAEQHDQLLTPIARQLEVVVQEAVKQNSQIQSESIESQISQIAKSLLYRSVFASLVGGGVIASVVVGLFLWNQ